MDVILKDDRRINPRTAARSVRLCEIVAEIRYNARYATYGEKIAEIERRYKISRGQATEDFDDCARFAAEHLAANASRIKADLLLGAQADLERGSELIDDARDAAAIAAGRVNMAKAIEELDPTRWTTGADTVTAVLLALTQCDLNDEQMELLRQFANRIDEVRDE